LRTTLATMTDMKKVQGILVSLSGPDKPNQKKFIQTLRKLSKELAGVHPLIDAIANLESSERKGLAINLQQLAADLATETRKLGRLHDDFTYQDSLHHYAGANYTKSDYTEPWNKWQQSKERYTFVQSISEPVCRMNDTAILIPEVVDENTIGIARRAFLTERRKELIAQSCALENQKEQADAAEIRIIKEWIEVQANQDKRRELRGMQKKLKNTINYNKRRKQHAIDAVKKQAEAEWDRAIDADKRRRK
jgi:hypothetical protein